MNEPFKASVQYGDFKGTAAADRADEGLLHKWIDERNLRDDPDKETLIGISMSIRENRRGEHEDPVHVTFYFATPGSYDGVKKAISESGDPIPVRDVDIQMNLSEFFSLFKRFQVKISTRGILEGREISLAELG